MVYVAILATLFVGRPLAAMVSDQNVAAVFFLLGMLLVGLTIAFHAFKTKPGKIEIVVWIGLSAVILMFLLRLGLAERSHVIEYSVLAILIHLAFQERSNNDETFKHPAIKAILLAFTLGVIDECLQIFMPSRHFDPTDIFFNGMAVVAAIGTKIFLRWLRNQLSKRNS